MRFSVQLHVSATWLKHARPKDFQELQTVPRSPVFFSSLFLNSLTASVAPEDFSCKSALVLDFGAENHRRLRRDARYEDTSHSSLHTSSSSVSLSNRNFFCS